MSKVGLESMPLYLIHPFYHNDASNSSSGASGNEAEACAGPGKTRTHTSFEENLNQTLIETELCYLGPYTNAGTGLRRGGCLRTQRTHTHTHTLNQQSVCSHTLLNSMHKQKEDISTSGQGADLQQRSNKNRNFSPAMTHNHVTTGIILHNSAAEAGGKKRV